MSKLNFDLSGEVALVTGSSRGIGKSCALTLARAGAEVIVHYVRSEDQAKSVVSEIESFGGKARTVQFDASNVEQVKTNLKEITKEITPTILVNNSGVNKDGLLARYSTDDWNQIQDTNLRGPFVITQCLLRGMMKQKKGSIIHMSSVVGLTGSAGQPAYCAAKAGLIGLTKSMARELSSRNIRVNAICPGFINTDMTEKLDDTQKQAIMNQIPLGKMGHPEDVGHMVLFLASRYSQYVTGQVLVVDGGMTMSG